MKWTTTLLHLLELGLAICADVDAFALRHPSMQGMPTPTLCPRDLSAYNCRWTIDSLMAWRTGFWEGYR